MTLESISLLRTLYMDVLSTPYIAAILMQDSPSDLFWKISLTIIGVSFLMQLGLSIALKRPAFIAWAWLYERVAHSRFLTILFDLLKSLWLTSVFSLSGKKAFATNLCTVKDFPEQSLLRETYAYPALFMHCDKTRPCIIADPYLCPTTLSKLRTLPSELTSYKPSYPSIFSHFSAMFLPIKRMSYFTMRNIK